MKWIVVELVKVKRKRKEKEKNRLEREGPAAACSWCNSQNCTLTIYAPYRLARCIVYPPSIAFLILRRG